jgi:hypothetical protein
MTVLTMRYQQGHFVVSSPDTEPVKFKTRSEAREWCLRHYPGSPIRDWRRSIPIERPKAEGSGGNGG